MEGYKTYRHENNPLEKDFHDKFIENFVRPGIWNLEQICLPPNCNLGLTEHEQKIMISTIQWLGSPVGQSFLKSVGYEYKHK